MGTTVSQSMHTVESQFLYPRHGGWIFDNFPSTRDQWATYVEKALEKNLLPDDVVCLQDPSENGDFLVKRWYYLNRGEIDTKIEERKEREAEEKKHREEEER